MYPQGPVDPGAIEAQEDAQVDARPRGSSGGAVRARLVSFLLQEVSQDLFVPPILLFANICFAHP